MKILADFRIKIAAIVALFTLAAGAVVFAQIEGGDRGVPPLASSGDFEVMGIQVDVHADSGSEARKKGWEEAQRKAWQQLYKRTHGSDGGALNDAALNNIVSAIVVQQEQIGPKRYIATLGVLFDRARAGTILGVGGNRLRSPPLLVLPIMWSGGSPQVFENRTEWQKAWARFRPGESAIDYVRPYGSGGESLVLTAGQADKRDRLWWRNILDQFGAADVIIPIARLSYSYPGGPVTGIFSARYGPDNKYISSFSLKVKNSEEIPQMLDEAIVRLDNLYSNALSSGVLTTEKTLIIDDPLGLDDLAAEETVAPDGTAAIPGAGADPNITGDGDGSDAPAAAITTISVQFETPDPGAVSRGEASVRSVPGVTGATTTSLALGGVSVMRVSYGGDITALATELRAKGWQVQQGAGALRISRAGDGAKP